MGDFLIATLITTIVCFVIIGRKLYVALQQDAERAKAASLISYDGEFTATLIDRSPQIADIIKIVDDHNYTIKYEPEKLHVGAVSVGGVTTGGAYTTGGYNYVSGSSKSGYCNLEYAGNMVTKIKLTSEQFDKAKKSVIAPYLNEKEKQIDVHTPVQYTEMEAKMILIGIKTTGSIGNAAKKGYPSREKCEQILGWLCGSDA